MDGRPDLRVPPVGRSCRGWGIQARARSTGRSQVPGRIRPGRVR
jgi:hypothetical protein